MTSISQINSENDLMPEFHRKGFSGEKKGGKTKINIYNIALGFFALNSLKLHRG